MDVIDGVLKAVPAWKVLYEWYKEWQLDHTHLDNIINRAFEFITSFIIDQIYSHAATLSIPIPQLQWAIFLIINILKVCLWFYNCVTNQTRSSTSDLDKASEEYIKAFYQMFVYMKWGYRGEQVSELISKLLSNCKDLLLGEKEESVTAKLWRFFSKMFSMFDFRFIMSLAAPLLAINN